MGHKVWGDLARPCVLLRYTSISARREQSKSINVWKTFSGHCDQGRNLFFSYQKQNENTKPILFLSWILYHVCRVCLQATIVLKVVQKTFSFVFLRSFMYRICQNNPHLHGSMKTTAVLCQYLPR